MYLEKAREQSFMSKNTDKNDFDIASRLIQAVGILSVVILAVYDLGNTEEQVNWLVYGLLGGVALGARPEDARDIFGAIFGLRRRDDDK